MAPEPSRIHSSRLPVWSLTYASSAAPVASVPKACVIVSEYTGSTWLPGAATIRLAALARGDRSQMSQLPSWKRWKARCWGLPPKNMGPHAGLASGAPSVVSFVALLSGEAAAGSRTQISPCESSLRW